MRPASGSASVVPTMTSSSASTVDLVPDGRADHDDAVRAAGGDDRGPQPPLELADATLEERLLVASGLVVRVLAQVAELAGVLDALDDLRSLHGRQERQLGLERGEAVGGQVRRGLRARPVPPAARRATGTRARRLDRRHARPRDAAGRPA